MPYFLRFNKFQISPSRPLPTPKNTLLCTTQNRAGPPGHRTPCARVSASQQPPPFPAANLQGLPCKGRCRRRRRRGAAPRPANTLPARRTRSPDTYLRRDRCFASARRQTSRQTVAYPSVPVPGHNVGRAFTPAAAALRHYTAPHSAKSPLRRSIRQPAAAPSSPAANR